jgi:hypothetical protein
VTLLSITLINAALKLPLSSAVLILFRQQFVIPNSICHFLMDVLSKHNFSLVLFIVTFNYVILFVLVLVLVATSNTITMHAC